MAFVTVAIPSTLKRFTEDQSRIELEAIDLQECLRVLGDLHPKLRPRLFSSSGDLFQFVGIFLNGTNIKGNKKHLEMLKNGDQIALIPPIAGG